MEEGVGGAGGGRLFTSEMGVKSWFWSGERRICSVFYCVQTS